MHLYGIKPPHSVLPATSQFHFLPISPKPMGVRCHQCKIQGKSPQNSNPPHPNSPFLVEKSHYFFEAISPLLRKIGALEMVLYGRRSFLHPGNKWQKKGSERLRYQKSLSLPFPSSYNRPWQQTFGSDCFLVITACQKILFAS